MYAPSTRAADISRLLDPAYASGSSSSSSSTTTPTHHRHGQTRAYVDRHGDLHDPDYRDFPVLPTTARTTSASRRRRPSHDARSRSTSRHADHRYSSAYSYTRPEWERDWTEGEDEDEDVFDDNESQSHYSPFASHAATRRSPAVHSRSAYRPYVSVPYSDYTNEPQLISSSPIDSLDDHSPSMMQESPLYESSFFGDDLEESEERRKKSRRSSGTSAILGRKNSKKASSQVKETPLDGSSEKSDSEHAAQQSSVNGARADEVYVYFLATQSLSEKLTQHTCSPSCSDALRQQWARIALSVKFSVFRARRRLKSRKSRSDTSRYPT